MYILITAPKMLLKELQVQEEGMSDLDEENAEVEDK